MLFLLVVQRSWFPTLIVHEFWCFSSTIINIIWQHDKMGGIRPAVLTHLRVDGDSGRAGVVHHGGPCGGGGAWLEGGGGYVNIIHVLLKKHIKVSVNHMRRTDYSSKIKTLPQYNSKVNTGQQTQHIWKYIIIGENNWYEDKEMVISYRIHLNSSSELLRLRLVKAVLFKVKSKKVTYKWLQHISYLKIETPSNDTETNT